MKLLLLLVVVVYIYAVDFEGQMSRSRYLFQFFWDPWSPTSEMLKYNTIQYNCLFRAPIAKNKSYSKALYIVQSTVTTYIIRNKFETDEFLVWFWMIR